MTPELRSRVLADWRGYREEKAKPDRAQAVAACLEKVMTQLGLAERLTESQVLGAWCNRACCTSWTAIANETSWGS